MKTTGLIEIFVKLLSANDENGKTISLESIDFIGLAKQNNMF